MDLMVGYLLRMIFHRFDLPLPVFRGSKGPIWRKLSLRAAASEAISHTYTTCFSECCYHVMYGVHMDLGQSACMYGGRGFLRLPCFRFLFLSGILGLAAGQGGPVGMHPSRSLGAVPGPHRIHGVLT